MGKKVFISYSWDSEEHQTWIANLAATLRKYEIEADFDASEVQSNLYQMMVEKIRIYDKIVVVATQRYTDKANSFSGGVGTETKLLLNHFVNNESKIVVVKRGNCDVPFYLKGYEFVDLTSEDKSSIENLVRKINDIPKYSLPPVKQEDCPISSKYVDGFDLDNEIPDLRTVTTQGKDDYLKEQFEIADKTVLDLLQKTKLKNPELNIEHEAKEVASSSGQYFGVDSLQGSNYVVCSYSIKYQEKDAYYKIWLSLNDRMLGKGIFGSSERPIFSTYNKEFNSYNLWVYVSPSSKQPCLACNSIWGSGQITNGEELGKYIFKCLIKRIQQ